jgi:hypothetical protein
VGSSGSNGIVERAVQTVEGQVRILKMALEARLQTKVPATSNIVAFMADYAAYLVNRLEIGKDGKSAYERCRGKAASVLGVEFGEKLMYKKRVRDKAAKIEARWDKAIFVGVRSCSGELWVATPEGIRKARSVRRLPVQDRWSADSLLWVRHVPWHLYKAMKQLTETFRENSCMMRFPCRAREGWRISSSRLVLFRPALSKSAKKMRRDSVTPGAVRDAPLGSAGWGGNPTTQSVEPDSKA